jgi:Secretion system C-terminal sorting domain
MLYHVRMLGFIIALGGFAQGASSQDHCWIKYLYDAAGNRIERKWWCGDPHVVESDEKSMAEQPFGLTIAPNPTRDVFTLTSETTMENASVELVNSEGRTAARTVLYGNRCEVDVTGLDAGVYVVLIRNGQVEYQGRVTVMR